MNTTIFNHILRGTVLDNTGIRGRCKIFVPGIYPYEYHKDAGALPWAEPAMSLVGGNYTSTTASSEMDDSSPLCANETGFAGWPKRGAEVWVFFENGNHNKPIYFAAVQSGPGWISEHPSQHVYKSDNVRIRIDENPSNAASTSRFDTYNTNCTYLSQDLAQTNVPTRVDIEVFGNVNFHVRGNVNLKVEGDVFEEIVGDKHETLIGNLYRKHVGSTHYVHQGTIKNEHNGDFISHTVGDKFVSQEGVDNLAVAGGRATIINGPDSIVVSSQRNEQFQTKNTMVAGNEDQQINGSRTTIIRGSDIETISLSKTINVLKDFTVSSLKTLYLIGLRRIIFRTPKPYPTKG